MSVLTETLATFFRDLGMMLAGFSEGDDFLFYRCIGIECLSIVVSEARLAM